MKTFTYQVIYSDGATDTHVLPKKATLEQLQAWVCGYIQLVKVLPKQWIVVNEEGRLNGMSINPSMTWQGQALHGPIVMLPKGCRS